MSEYATGGKSLEEHIAEKKAIQDALLQKKEVLKNFSVDQLLEIKEKALEMLNEAEEVVHIVNAILDDTES